MTRTGNPVYKARDDYYNDYKDFDDFGKSVGKKKMDVNFLVKPGDVLTLKEEEGAAIKVFSLNVGRGKKFSYRMNYDQYIL